MKEPPKCPYCGATMNDDGFCWECPNCHEPVPIEEDEASKKEKPTCPYCGATMVNDSYCWVCLKCCSSSPVVIYEPCCAFMSEEEKSEYARRKALDRVWPGGYTRTIDRVPELPDSDWCEVMVIAHLPGKTKVQPMIYERVLKRKKRVERWKYHYGIIADETPDCWMYLPAYNLNGGGD